MAKRLELKRLIFATAYESVNIELSIAIEIRLFLECDLVRGFR